MEGTDACLKVGLDQHGITNPSTLFRNLTYQELFEHEQKNNEGVVAKAEYGETFTVDTGKYTGELHKNGIFASHWQLYVSTKTKHSFQSLV